MIGDLAAAGRRAGPDHTGRLWRALVPLGVGVAVAVMPQPPGLAAFAWHYLAVFVAVILALITEPIPPAGAGLMGVTVAGVFGLAFSPSQLADPAFKFPAEALRWALAGFINSTVWLIFGAFVFAMGYEKTGLGRRIALVLVRRLGGSSLGLGYAIAASDLLLAPFTPSNTARSAGTVFPVIDRIPELYGSRPGESPRRIGAYLMWVAFASTCVTSSMFITALAPNLLAIDFVRKATGIDITWTNWFISFLPIGAPLLIALPWLVYKLYPPQVRSSDEVPRWAAQELQKLGRLTRKEGIMAALVIGALAFWIGGASLIDPAMVALAGISLMIAFDLVDWNDIAGNRTGWNVFISFGTLIVLADGLAKVGVIDWVGRAVSTLLAGHSPIVVLTMFVVLFFVVHYMFASLTAHATALMPVMLAAGVSVPGMPVRTFTMLMCFSLGLMGVLTPYATGPAPVYFGSGYIERRAFWRLGFIFGLIFLIVLLVVGIPSVMLLS
ncbi:MAG TPA: anion permease [Tepidisphaeraceae bacterium]